MFKSVRSNKISDHIVEQIRNAIFDGRLKPGDRLPPEKTLMENFKVSKVTLREALRSLEILGLLEIRKGVSGGPFVTEVDMKTARDSLTNFLLFKNLSPKELSEVRLLVESYIAEKAAQVISEEDLKKLERLMIEFHNSLKKDLPVEFYNRQIEFHRILGNATGNPILIFILDFISNILIGMKEIWKPEKEFYRKVLKAHRRIYKALSERDPKRARDEMNKHVFEEEKDLIEIRKKQSMQALDLRRYALGNFSILHSPENE
jgi:GntR family transcriptional repressor for pyruvate dehydrogenase complex